MYGLLKFPLGKASILVVSLGVDSALPLSGEFGGNSQILEIPFAGSGGSTSTSDLTRMQVEMFGRAELLLFLGNLRGEFCFCRLLGLSVFFCLVGMRDQGLFRCTATRADG